ncbi:PA2169 family four-helix-bundle protein [Pacificimonas sp. WHA3]|uniref:PA2169 family four-helix-bundle protein n=1 Tax=Pacificimonas pallii TaxID=2827236 RepID=A0ABS6SFJ2_9SPHN|nr:PA2169 family four-helix-bundle protein [Pacificimonas pallii]MBV7257180.1 PA2169 family four-helix-bundle protein [Pacificimonas pallii]
MSSTVLQTLTDTAIDSLKGYELAAERAKSPELKQVLVDQAAKRRATVEMLKTEVARQGGTLTTEGTVTGDLHRIWTKVADLFQSGDAVAAESVEEGEDYISQKFWHALDKGDLDPAVRPTVQAAYDEISAGERLTDRLEKYYD